MAKVFIKFNEAVIKELLLTKDETTFGRKEGNDIVINHPAVSGFHGKIVKEGDRYSVVDLNSTNGTYVNGRRVSKSALQNKDLIRVAIHVLEFTTDDDSVASPPPPKGNPPQTGGIPAQPASAPPKPPSKPKEKSEPVKVKIIAGAVNNQNEIIIKDLVTYIGTSEKASVKIKGFLAPDLAAAISRKPDGYFLQAIKEGYPKVNGATVQQQALLTNGSTIECGGTNMVFYNHEEQKKAEESKKKEEESKKKATPPPSTGT